MGISGGPCVAQLGMRHRQSQGFGQAGLQDLSCRHHCNGVLGSQPRAISISNNLVAAAIRPRGNPGKGRARGTQKQWSAFGNAAVGLGFVWLPGPQGGRWQKQHELWRRTRIKWVYGYARGGRLSQTLQHQDLCILLTILPAAVPSDASAP